MDPATSDLLHDEFQTAWTGALTVRFCRELDGKHGVRETEFSRGPSERLRASEDVADDPVLVDGTPWLRAASRRYGLGFSAFPAEPERGRTSRRRDKTTNHPVHG